MVNDRFGDNAAHADAAAGGQTAIKPPPIGGRPGWFRKNQASKDAAPPRRKPLIAFAPDDEEPLDWPERFKRWLHSFAATGFGISLFVHAVLLVVLALIVFNTEDEVALVTNLEFQKSLDQNEFVDVEELSFDPPAAAVEHSTPALQTFDQTLDFPDIAVPAASLPAAGGGEEGGNKDGAGISRPGNAVTKGSFTVWTNPEDPDPRQSYHIIIEVKLPKGKRYRRYPRKDLVGTVIGTDGYKKEFGKHPSESNKFLPVRDGVARLIILIPGAEKNVKDVIKVQSVKILKERQTIELVF